MLSALRRTESVTIEAFDTFVDLARVYFDVTV